MRYLPFQQIRELEIAAGHDQILGSAINLAMGPGVEDGEATLMGRRPDGSTAVFLMLDIHGGATLVDQCGNVLFNYSNLEEEQGTLALYEWLYPY